MTKTQLAKDAEAYLATIQDSYPNEYYATDRALAASWISDFLAFINVKHKLEEVENKNE